MKKSFWLWIASVIAIVSLSASFIGAAQIRETSMTADIDDLASRFVAAYQAKDADKLAGLYAASVNVGGHVYSRAEIRQQYSLLFGKLKDTTISSITITGKDSFKPADSQRRDSTTASGILQLRINYTKGGLSKTSNASLPWTVSRPQGAAQWNIAETAKLTVTDDAPAEGH